MFDLTVSGKCTRVGAVIASFDGVAARLFACFTRQTGLVRPEVRCG